MMWGLLSRTSHKSYYNNNIEEESNPGCKGKMTLDGEIVLSFLSPYLFLTQQLNKFYYYYL